jgi:hypothetical protein
MSQTNHETTIQDDTFATPYHSSVYHRLPKLDLQKFNGNILDWQSFWDSFKSAFHTNPSLSGVQKFNYLKSSLRGEATQIIAGFALTNVNYDKAASLLHERYGKRDRIIHTYTTIIGVTRNILSCFDVCNVTCLYFRQQSNSSFSHVNVYMTRGPFSGR